MMIQITPHMRILVAVEPIDFRAGIDALVGAVRSIDCVLLVPDACGAKRHRAHDTRLTSCSIRQGPCRL